MHGCYHIPLDPHGNTEYLRSVISSSHAASIACRPNMATTAKDMISCVIEVADNQWTSLCNQNDISTTGSWSLVSPMPSTSEIAYVLYTSGTTGQPKGIQISHSSLLNYLRIAQSRYLEDPGNLSNSKHVPLHSALTFDATQTSLMLPLVAGLTVEVIHEESMSNFATSVFTKAWRFIKLTPRQLDMYLRSSPMTIPPPVVIVGGERLHLNTVRFMQAIMPRQAKITLYNEYGPTEATVGCIAHRVVLSKNLDLATTSVSENVPIGLPFPRQDIMVLDLYGLPVLPGCPGELYLLGPSLARGYTSTASEADLAAWVTINGLRAYRTGDLVMYVMIGSTYVLEFCDRIAGRIKIHDALVNTEAVEAVLVRASDDIVAASVFLEHVSTGLGAAVQIPSWPSSCVLKRGEDPITAALEQYLEHTLPRHMIPDTFLFLNTDLPLTKHGKMSTPCLEILLVETQPNPVPKDSVLHVDGSYVPNDRGTSKRVIDILRPLLSNLLSVDMRSHNFDRKSIYELGGDSFTLTRLSQRALAEGLRIELGPSSTSLVTLASTASFVTDSCVGSHPALTEVSVEDVYDRMSSEEGLRAHPMQIWACSKGRDPRSHIQSHAIDVAKDIGVDEVELALTKVLRMFPSLRSRFFIGEGDGGLSRDRPEPRIPVVSGIQLLTDATVLSVDPSLIINDSHARDDPEIERVKQHMSLEDGKLVVAVLKELENTGENNRVILYVHHFCVDAVSWTIIEKSFVDFLTEPEGTGGERDPEDSLLYYRYTLWMWRQTDQFMLSFPYWNSVCERGSFLDTNSIWPGPRVGDPGPVGLIVQAKTVLPLRKVLQHRSLQSFENVILACLSISTARASQGLPSDTPNALYLNVESTGRSTGVVSAVGWFTERYPVLLPFLNQDPGATLTSILDQIENTLPSQEQKQAFGFLAYSQGLPSGDVDMDKCAPWHLSELLPHWTLNYLGVQEDDTFVDVQSAGRSFYGDHEDVELLTYINKNGDLVILPQGHLTSRRLQDTLDHVPTVFDWLCSLSLASSPESVDDIMALLSNPAIESIRPASAFQQAFAQEQEVAMELQSMQAVYRITRTCGQLSVSDVLSRLQETWDRTVSLVEPLRSFYAPIDSPKSGVIAVVKAECVTAQNTQWKLHDRPLVLPKRGARGRTQEVGHVLSEIRSDVLVRRGKSIDSSNAGDTTMHRAMSRLSTWQIDFFLALEKNSKKDIGTLVISYDHTHLDGHSRRRIWDIFTRILQEDDVGDEPHLRYPSPGRCEKNCDLRDEHLQVLPYELRSMMLEAASSYWQSQIQIPDLEHVAPINKLPFSDSGDDLNSVMLSRTIEIPRSMWDTIIQNARELEVTPNDLLQGAIAMSLHDGSQEGLSMFSCYSSKSGSEQRSTWPSTNQIPVVVPVGGSSVLDDIARQVRDQRHTRTPHERFSLEPLGKEERIVCGNVLFVSDDYITDYDSHESKKGLVQGESDSVDDKFCIEKLTLVTNGEEIELLLSDTFEPSTARLLIFTLPSPSGGVYLGCQYRRSTSSLSAVLLTRTIRYLIVEKAQPRDLTPLSPLENTETVVREFYEKGHAFQLLSHLVDAILIQENSGILDELAYPWLFAQRWNLKRYLRCEPTEHILAEVEDLITAYEDRMSFEQSADEDRVLSSPCVLLAILRYLSQTGPFIPQFEPFVARVVCLLRPFLSPVCDSVIRQDVWDALARMLDRVPPQHYQASSIYRKLVRRLLCDPERLIDYQGLSPLLAIEVTENLPIQPLGATERFDAVSASLALCRHYLCSVSGENQLRLLRRELVQITLLSEGGVRGLFVHAILVAALCAQAMCNGWLWPVSSEEEELCSTSPSTIEGTTREPHDSTQVLLALLRLACRYNPNDIAFLREVKIETISEIATTGAVDQTLFTACFLHLNRLTHDFVVHHVVSGGSDDLEVVTAMYNDHPYPIWLASSYETSSSIQVKMLRETGRHAYDAASKLMRRVPVPGGDRVLVAGCGTGLHLINVAMELERYQVSGFDISPQSVEYFRSRLLQTPNDCYPVVDIFVADITDSSSFKNESDPLFTHIECAGVLHHLADPKQGLRSLVDALHVGGTMKLGLYSTISRRHLEATSSHDDPITHNDLVALREEYLRRTETDPLRQFLLQNPRELFHSSSFRDLCCHVRERTYTLTEIKLLLEEFNLEFLGFAGLSDECMSHFLAEYGEDNLTNLTTWQSFHENHPSLIPWYLFFVQKV